MTVFLAQLLGPTRCVCGSDYCRYPTASAFGFISEAVGRAVGAVAARCAYHDAAAAEDCVARALSPCTGRDHRNAESGKNPFHHVHLLGLMFPGGSPVETDSVSLRFRFAIDSLSTRLGTRRASFDSWRHRPHPHASWRRLLPYSRMHFQSFACPCILSPFDCRW
jgi:hypothetical protein